MKTLTGAIQSRPGSDLQIIDLKPVSGGDINEAYIVSLSDGRYAFLKKNTIENAGFFRTEMNGLKAIRDTNTISVPEVFATGTDERSSWLLMEYLEAGHRKTGYWERFGRQLAAMHRADTSSWTPGGIYGFTEDNYIGAGQQINEVRNSWIGFFRECRLEVQFQRASHFFDESGRKAVQFLLDHLEDYLVEPEYPSLLHGDLWGGNYVTGPDGYAWLIDPAVYVGHAEADLAMTELFGGFTDRFYDSYREVNPLQPGYSDRREIYNLYHLLNHLNLFGAGYYTPVMQIVKRFARG